MSDNPTRQMWDALPSRTTWAHYNSERLRRKLAKIRADRAEHGWAEARVIITGQSGRLSVLEREVEILRELLGETHQLLVEHHAANLCCRPGGAPCIQCSAKPGGLFHRIEAAIAPNAS